MLSLAAGESPDLEAGLPGALYLLKLDEWSPEDLRALEARAGKAGWRLLGGTRNRAADHGGLDGWTGLRLQPLRERHDDLKALTRLYVERYRRQQGLPRRRLARSMWPLILSHQWPGNARELENFALHLVTACPGPTITARDLPASVVALLESAPHAALREQAGSFEELVESRLRPMVQQYEPGSEVGLYRLTIEATERALLRLALSRTGGNQKAAAVMLGIARNTLRTKAEALGLTSAQSR